MKGFFFYYLFNMVGIVLATKFEQKVFHKIGKRFQFTHTNRKYVLGLTLYNENVF